jgi:hypothetical protein
MKKDNVVEFKSKKDLKNTDYHLDEINFNMEDLGISFSFSEEVMERIFSDVVMQDTQLNDLSNDIFELQILCEENPEIAQFVSAHVRKFTEFMKKKLKTDV